MCSLPVTPKATSTVQMTTVQMTTVRMTTVTTEKPSIYNLLLLLRHSIVSDAREQTVITILKHARSI